MTWDEAIAAASESDAKGGFVYFIGHPEVAIKIGVAGSPKARLRALQIANHVELRILATVWGSEFIEQAYHSRFSAHRIRGEWFAPHPEILAEIGRLNAVKD